MMPATASAWLIGRGSTAPSPLGDLGCVICIVSDRVASALALVAAHRPLQALGTSSPSERPQHLFHLPGFHNLGRRRRPDLSLLARPLAQRSHHLGPGTVSAPPCAAGPAETHCRRRPSGPPLDRRPTRRAQPHRSERVCPALEVASVRYSLQLPRPPTLAMACQRQVLGQILLSSPLHRIYYRAILAPHLEVLGPPRCQDVHLTRCP